MTLLLRPEDLGWPWWLAILVALARHDGDRLPARARDHEGRRALLRRDARRAAHLVGRRPDPDHAVLDVRDDPDPGRHRHRHRQRLPEPRSGGGSSGRRGGGLRALAAPDRTFPSRGGPVRETARRDRASRPSGWRSSTFAAVWYANKDRGVPKVTVILGGLPRVLVVRGVADALRPPRLRGRRQCRGSASGRDQRRSRPHRGVHDRRVHGGRRRDHAGLDGSVRWRRTREAATCS